MMMKRVMSWSVAIAAPLGATTAFWVVFGLCVGAIGCVDGPYEPPEPASRVFAHWDPLACGEPHRVVIDLEDEGGAPLASSAPCNRGGLTLGANHWGRYRGQIYAWHLDEDPTNETSVSLTIDAEVIHWQIDAP